MTAPARAWDTEGESMSKFVCEKCGMDCGSSLAFGKHGKKCEGRPKSEIIADVGAGAVGDPGQVADHPRFVNRFKAVADGDRCPKCSNMGKSFYKHDDYTWVCLECGTHFTRRAALAALREECAGVSWKRV